MQSVRRRLHVSAALAALLGPAGLAPAALAQTPPAPQPAPVTTVTRGAYVFGDIGANWLRDAHSRGTTTTYSYDTGWAGVVGGGWGFGNGIRVEGELGHRDSNASNSTGGTDATSFMVNALYDFNTRTPFTPYVGVGTGFADIHFDNVRTPTSRIDDSDVRWAYQAIAGTTYQLNNHWKLDANYRYFGTERPELTADDGTTVRSHYRDHALLLGVRYEFGN